MTREALRSQRTHTALHGRSLEEDLAGVTLRCLPIYPSCFIKRRLPRINVMISAVF